MKLDKFLKTYTNMSIQSARNAISQGIVRVNDVTIKDLQFKVGKFTRVCLAEAVIQDNTAHYFMLNKPAGVVSSTLHDEHLTVLDSISLAYKHELHLAGRLDFNTTGLIVLTNNGIWSRHLTQPEKKIPKVYSVETENPMTTDYIERFASGMYFPYENITLKPAKLEILSDYKARLTIYEGRYHQVKRMFGFYDNKVTVLHRESMGDIVLDKSLACGEFRQLTTSEIASVL